MAKMKPNTRLVFDYLRDHVDEEMTAAEVAEAVGLEKRQVDGIFTSAIQRKGLGVRVPVEREEEDGTHSKVKLLKLTDDALTFDPDVEE